MTGHFDLPAGWVRKPLDDAAQLVKEKVDPTTVPDSDYIGLEHVEAHTMRLLGRGRGSDVKSAKTKFSAGDVLYGKLRPYLNKVARPSFDGISSTDFLVFTESPDLDPGYLAQFLNQLSVANYAHHRSAGVELPRVGWKSLSTLPISFPLSKVEQRAVVSQIERARGLAKSADAHLAAALRAIERFRQAVLAAACSGRLTADWRDGRELEPADASIERRRESERLRLGRKYRDPFTPDIDKLPEIPAGWTWATLPELGDLGRGKSKHRPRNDPKLYGGMYPFIQTGDVARSRGRVTSHSQTYNEAGLAQSRLWPDRTVCITIAANIADSGLLTYPACFPDSVVGLIADQSVVLPEYVELFIRTARRDLAMFAPATAQANINLAILSELAVAVPPLEEQRELVDRTHGLFDSADSILARVEAASRHVDRGSQAILAKAFRGELTTTGTQARQEEPNSLRECDATRDVLSTAEKPIQSAASHRR